MKKIITISIISILLLTLAIYELVNVNAIINYLEKNVDGLYAKYEDNKENITILTEEVIKINNYWEEREDALYVIFSHKDLSPLSDSMIKLLAYTKNNDFDNAYAEIELLRSLTYNISRNMGFNIQNVL